LTRFEVFFRTQTGGREKTRLGPHFFGKCRLQSRPFTERLCSHEYTNSSNHALHRHAGGLGKHGSFSSAGRCHFRFHGWSERRWVCPFVTLNPEPTFGESGDIDSPHYLPEWVETSAPLVPSLKPSLAPGFDVHEAVAAPH